MAGTDFEIDIPVSGASQAEQAANAVLRLASQLESAKAATGAAGEAVRQAQASYAGAEAAADRAAKAVEKVTAAADAQRGKIEASLKIGNVQGAEQAAVKLNALIMRQTEAAQAASEAKGAMLAEASALDKLSAASDQAKAHEGQLSKAQDAAKKASDATTKAAKEAGGSGKVNEMAEGLGKLGGPLGAAGQKALGFAEGLKKMSGSLGSVGPYVAIGVAIVAIAAGAALAAAAFVAAAGAVLKYAIANSDANRTARLLSDGIAGSVKGGALLDARISALVTKVPQSAEDLRNMAKELAKTGLEGKALADALETAAVKAAKAEWGDDYAKQVNSVSKQSAILQGHFTKLFSLKTDALEGGFSKIVALFDESSVTGKAIKAVFAAIFQPMIDGITALVPKVITGFIQMQIWFFKAYLALAPHAKLINAIGIAFAVFAGIIVLLAGILVVGIIMPFVALIAIGTALVAGVILTYQAFQALWGIISGAGSTALTWLTETFNQVVAFLKGIDLAKIGKEMIAGLIAGITGGGAGVLGSITGLMGGAIGAAEKVLKIGSPSKVFAEIGMQTAEGMAGGVDAGASGVEGSMQDMVAPPAASGGSGAKGGGGHTFQITIEAPGGDAPSIAAAVRDVLRDLLGGDATERGDLVPETT